MPNDEEWMPPEDIWDARRKAPFHFLAKADNARMSAFVLSNNGEQLSSELATEAGYNGSLRIALHEGFMREASIAIELILKAVICVAEKKAPPAIHDVFELWSRAKLPELPADDWFRLTHMTETLYWSGRYGAPRSNKDLLKPQERYKKFQRSKFLGTLRVNTHIPLEWPEFENLYQIAAYRFWELDPNDPKNFVA